jgi:hypothetical protein
MNYAKLENGNWIEVQGNNVPEEVLFTLGFKRLTKYSGEPLTENQHIVIEEQNGECVEVVLTTTHCASINAISKDISGVMVEFFEAKFPQTKTVTREGNNLFALFTLQESHRREWQKMVWDKWAEYMQDYIETKSAGDETNSATGVRLNDLLMASFLGTDQWAIQPITAGAPLTGTALSVFIADLKDALTAKYTAVRAACIVTTVEQAECEAALYHTANFIMRNIIPGE